MMGSWDQGSHTFQTLPLKGEFLRNFEKARYMPYKIETPSSSNMDPIYLLLMEV